MPRWSLPAGSWASGRDWNTLRFRVSRPQPGDVRMHDLVIRGGTVVDGTGAPASPPTSPSTTARSPRSGGSTARAREEIDADGRLVTPGFVDIHTHYDGQVTWDPLLDAVVLARRHHRRDGQLRRRLRAGAPRPARVADRAHGGRRGHPRRGAVGRASSGGGRRFPEFLDVLEHAASSRSTSARRCRTARCAAT